MKKAKRKADWLLYLVGGIVVLITFVLVVANYTPVPIPTRATSAYTIELGCDAITIIVQSTKESQTSNNSVYAVNLATKERFTVEKKSQTDIELPLNFQSPILRQFTAGQLPSGIYDVFLEDANGVVVERVSEVEKNCRH